MRTNSKQRGIRAHSRPTRFIEALEERRLLAAVLVRDINLTGAGSFPRGLVEYRDHVYYFAQELNDGRGLWRTPVAANGGGAERVIGWEAGSQNALSLPLTVLNDRLIVEGAYGLFATDGTPDGTMLLKNLSVDERTTPVTIGGTLYLSATGDGIGRELWKTDGTPEGTVLVKDIRPGPSESRPTELTNVGGTLFFIADDGANGAELWKSDGTDSGTVLVKDIRSGASGSGPHELAAAGDILLLSADDGAAGRELWRSDGTPEGTVLATDIQPGPNSSFPEELTSANGVVFFSAASSSTAYQLWKSDGTTTTALGGGAPNFITRVGDRVFYQGSASTQDLWVSDGTLDGTHVVTDLNPGFSAIFVHHLTDMNGVMYGIINDNVSHGLWKSDGTIEGTELLRRFAAATNPPVAAGDSVFFSASDGIHGAELWRSDGTPETTRLVHDIHLGTAGSSPAALTRVKDKIHFLASGGAGQTGIWTTDGSAGGTEFVGPVARVQFLGQVGDRLLMRAHDPEHGSELWRTDGTPEGTGLLKDIWYGSRSSDIYVYAEYDGGMMFAADSTDSQLYNELWKTDGTPEGTVRVRAGLGAGGNITDMENLAGKVYFSVWGQLWTSDGTAQGTVRVATINPTGSASVHDFTVANGLLFFRATDGTHGAELWRTDGTPEGTWMVKDIQDGPDGSIPAALVSIGDAVLFMADDGMHGRELWRSDGTAAGTVLVKDAIPGAGGTGYGNIDQVPEARLGNLGIFIIRDPVAGDTIWRSDGTEAGTFRVPNLTPDAEPRTIHQPVQVADQLFFTNIRDLWRTDGRTMVAVSDASPLSTSSPFPSGLAELSGNLFFDSRSDDAVGSELYRISPPTADAGVSYSVSPGGLVELDGTASFDPDPAEVLTYAWDLDGDGIRGELGTDAARGDELGPVVTFAADGLLPGTYPVLLRVTNSAGLWHEASADVIVTEQQQVGIQTILGDETEDDQWTVRYSQGNVQVFRRIGSSLLLEHEWPSSEARELRFLGGGGDDRVSVFSTLPLTRIVLDGGDGDDTLLITADNDNGLAGPFERLEVYGGASVLLKQHLSTSVVELGDGSRLTLEQGAAIELRTHQVTIDPFFGDTLDINDNALVFAGRDPRPLEPLVAAARNAAGGRWTGAGITSTTAASAPLHGLGVGRVGSDVVVRYTYNGDANGDGVVNADDYFRIDSGFIAQPTEPLYAHGDFNFDDKINADDYFLIDSAFLGQGAAAAGMTIASTSTYEQTDSIARRKLAASVRRGDADLFQVRRRVASSRPGR